MTDEYSRKEKPATQDTQEADASAADYQIISSDEYYENHVEQHVEGFESARLLAQEDIRKRKIKGIVLFVAVCAVSLIVIPFIPVEKGENPVPFIIAPPLIFGVILWAWVKQPGRDFRGKIKYLIIPKMLDYYGGIVRYDPTPKRGIRTFKPSELLPSYSREVTEDEVVGEYRGIRFRFMEGELWKRRNKSERQVFDGAFIEFDLPFTFPGKVIIQPHSSLVDEAFYSFAGELEEVQSTNLVFNEYYEIKRSYQQSPARLMTDEFVGKILDLPGIWGASSTPSFKCSFYNQNKLLFMIYTGKDRFEPGSIDQHVDLKRGMNGVINDMEDIFWLIDFFRLYEMGSDL